MSEDQGVRGREAGPAPRIVFFSSAHPPFDKRVYDKEALSLARAGFEVIHVCPADAPVASRPGDGVEIRAVPRARGRWWRPRTLLRSAKAVAALKPDAIHCNEVDSWFVGAFLAKATGARCVFDAHEDYSAMVVERAPRRARALVRAIYAACVRVAAALTWKIVLAKHSIAEDYRFCADKLLTVSNYGPIHTADRLRPPEASGGPVRLVHLGLIGRLRGWPQLLEAMRLCADLDLKLNVVGEFNDESEQEFWAEVDRLDLRDRIRFEAWLPYDEAYALLLESDIGLVLFQPGPRNHERALPHKMFDYMMAQNALIAPAFAVEVAEIVRWSDAGLLVDPSDAGAVAAAIRTLAADPERRRAYGASGRRAVLERYNWDAEARKLVAMYSELRTRGSQAAPGTRRLVGSSAGS
ncbi:MAG: glycosyltransferase [Allosphingosinicella sp.]|uniref:glycosyltransferase n=1 Tax=Allosphingosinicella sp. TaxID=2823234 RepID=UPI00393264CC